MRVRAHSVLVQVWVALVCALGAGFSGDMVAHHPGHGSHSARHTRSAGHRGSRSFSRDGYGDHSAEVEVLDEVASLTAVHPGDHPAPAVLPTFVAFVPQFIQLDWAMPFQAFVPRAIDLLALPARAPPSLS